MRPLALQILFNSSTLWSPTCRISFPNKFDSTKAEQIAGGQQSNLAFVQKRDHRNLTVGAPLKEYWEADTEKVFCVLAVQPQVVVYLHE